MVVRRGASQLGENGLDAHGVNTERARLAGGHFVSHGLSAHGLSTERARIAGGTSLRSWFQKKCLPHVRIFFSQKIPDFESSSWNIFRLKKFSPKWLKMKK